MGIRINCAECGNHIYVGPEAFKIKSDYTLRCCEDCKIIVEKRKEALNKSSLRKCGLCGGTGKVKGYSCVPCDGKGEVLV